MEERLADIENDIERQLQIESAAARLKVDPAALKRDVDTIRRTTGILDRRRQPASGTAQAPPVRVDARRQLIGLLLKNQELLTRLRETGGPERLSLDMFDSPSGEPDLWQRAAEALFKNSEAGRTLAAADLMNEFTEIQEQQQIAQTFQDPLPEDKADLEKLLSDTVRMLKLRTLDEKLKKLTDQGISTQEDLTAMQDLIYEKRNLQSLQIRLNG